MSYTQVTLPEGAKGLAVKCIAENERIGHQVATQKILRVQCKDQPIESYHAPYLLPNISLDRVLSKTLFLSYRRS